jgi:large subunit ribosomal protein L29
MKNSEIKDLTLEALKETIDAKQNVLGDLKMAHAITPLENPMQIREARRLVARLRTELTKRQNQ